MQFALALAMNKNVNLDIKKPLALRIRNFVCFGFFGRSLATPAHPLALPLPRKSRKCNAWLHTQNVFVAAIAFSIGIALLFLFSFGCAWPPFRHAFITQVEVSIGFQFCHLLFAI